jgi:hypothetical protein
MIAIFMILFRMMHWTEWYHYKCIFNQWQIEKKDRSIRDTGRTDRSQTSRAEIQPEK